MQCSFDDNWIVVPINRLPPQKQWITERMARLRSEVQGATANILDLSYKEIRLKFVSSAIVGVGNGMFYCDSNEVLDTKIKDSPTIV
jgi:hypothetical protein